MAESEYIYLVRSKMGGKLVAAFTLKPEAKTWVKKSDWEFNEVYLTLMLNGPTNQKSYLAKPEQPTPWD